MTTPGSARSWTEHYAGDDTNVRIVAGGILAAFDGISVEDFDAHSDEFLRSAQHPTLGRGYLECAYAPMVELLRFLEANGFSNYIVSGGGRDFMRPISQDVYGIPRERVVGSASALAYTSDERGGTITHKAAPDYLDDGPEKPIRIWSRTGRRPLLAGGQLERRHPDAATSPSTPTSPSCACSCCTTTTSARPPTPRAPSRRSSGPPATAWTVVSMKDDWEKVFTT